ncbi:MAG: CDP-diacylglycerol--glycerol-3-phosphate 3-phosphatidyltransferase [Paracoccaceae bacterium]|jgi:CDP-diacylglycerol--glycerol-3-phosphate 3-phosphatidyltransferase
MRWNIPNILTVFRLLAALILPIPYILFSSPMADVIVITLFVGAAITDFLDGYIARKFNMMSNFGRMLDPIADKVMVVIALLLVVSLSASNLMNVWAWQDVLILLAATLILFREIFVSGLREFLGADAGKLQVTKLAKWKTTVQMLAIIAILISHMMQFYTAAAMFGMESDYARAVVFGEIEGDGNLYALYQSFKFATYTGLVLITLAAALTLVTGFDYFRKSLPYLREEN